MIKSKDISIKILEKNLLEKLRNLRNDSDTNIFLTSIVPINEYQQEEWFRTTCLDSTKMYFSIHDKKNNFIGIIRCDEWDKINNSIRLGIDIIPQFRRKGFATKTYKLFLKHLFFNLGINRAWLLVADYNERALKLYKNIGFKTEGKMREAIFRNNKYNDYIIMSILRKEYESK